MKKNKKIQKENTNEEKKHPIIKILLILILIGSICLLWARYISTKGLTIKEFAIKTTKLDDSYDGLKIVQFSDLHYGSTIGPKELENVVETINKQKPHIIVFTGDLVENKVVLNEKEINEVINILNKLNPTIETLAVIGNHDYDHNYWDIITKELNWHILDNTYEYVYYKSKMPIVFVGLDDLMEGKPDYDNAFSFLNETDKDHYTIVLAHEPDQVDEFKNYDFDLVLAGHSHLGQVRLPLIGALYTPEGSKKYYDEHYKINNADLYINGGIGTSILKLRFFNKPCIYLYRFYTK